MKKHILTIAFAIFCAVAVFAEIKIAVKQHVRYGNGEFATLDTPQISLTKALNEGGKVFFKYDFEITDKGFLESSYIIISVKFPSNDDYIFPWAKITALSGATDLSLGVLNAFKDGENKQWIQSKIERLPKNRSWNIYEVDENNNKSYKTYFWGIPLKLMNKKGNKATLEFYIDFKQIYDTYKYHLNSKDKDAANWDLQQLQEIPIDITFSPERELKNFAIPNEEGRNNGYDYFSIYVKNFSYWERDFSSSNRSFTILVRD